jgi:hypothetical protein
LSVHRVSHAAGAPAPAPTPNPAAKTAAAGPSSASVDTTAAFDSTAESAPDSAVSAADEAAARAEHLLVVGHLDDQARQTRLDRLRAAFDADQAERAESLREMNVLRDMALEQQKHDDEILKKWIALI